MIKTDDLIKVGDNIFIDSLIVIPSDIFYEKSFKKRYRVIRIEKTFLADYYYVDDEHFFIKTQFKKINKAMNYKSVINQFIKSYE